MANYIEDTSVLTSEQEVVCAWCQTDADPQGTHGICPSCAEKVMVGFYREKLNKVPSYAERFRNGKEKF